MEAGRELDALVADEIFGLSIEWNEDTPCPYCDCAMRYCGDRARCSVCEEWRYGPYKEYSEDIAAAWEVHKEACDWIFSQRRKYLNALQAIVTERMEAPPGSIISWPDVLAFLEPRDFCLAALTAKGIDLDSSRD
jgi:hypothetical protein